MYFSCIRCDNAEPVPPDASLADLGRARLCDCGGLMQIGAHRDPAALTRDRLPKIKGFGDPKMTAEQKAAGHGGVLSGRFKGWDV